MTQQITSFQNSKVKQVKKLRDKRERERAGRFVIEYSRDLERALECGYTIDYVLYCAALADADDEHLLAMIDMDKVFVVSEQIMGKVSYRQNPNGLVAVMHSKPVKSIDELCKLADTYVLALVGLEKPGNIGALLRTADAAGFGAILLVDTSLDLYNPNIIRSSTGACFLDNVYVVSGEEAILFFRERDYTIIAAEVEASQDLHSVDFPARSAIMLGTEDQGLDDGWLQYANIRVRIPMMGVLSDSLNVSVSGAVIMYEVLRQRALSDANL